jgi:type III pantothenate kinase
MALILAIDSGNSYIKWGFHNCDSWQAHGKVKHSEGFLLRQSWQNLPEPSVIVVSNVAGVLAQSLLTSICSIWTVAPHFITAKKFQCGVTNCYKNPAQLGSDRWAALIAAWNLQLKACLIVNIGTAMTVDMLSDSGYFLGGIITPGQDLMLQTLDTHTAIEISEIGKFDNSPVSSANAIYSGTVQSLVGAVERMSQLLSARLGHSINCIISGGAASLLLPHINISVCVVNNLVLDGLIRIVNDPDLTY